MFALNPVKLLVKEPVPVPFTVKSSARVGFWEVLQHTPLAVTGNPLSEVTFPPLEADVDVMPEADTVVTEGSVGITILLRQRTLKPNALSGVFIWELLPVKFRFLPVVGLV